MSDKRRHRRRIVDRPAKIAAAGCFIPCHIANSSEDGAMLRFSQRGWVPEGFDLEDTFSGVRRAARIVWRGINLIGVRFR